MDREVLTIKEACKALGCGRTKLYQLLGSHKIKAIRLGRKTLITRHEIARFISQLPIANINHQNSST